LGEGRRIIELDSSTSNASPATKLTKTRFLKV